MTGPALAPWVRTRLRTTPVAAVALAVLVAVTACLAAAFPRAVDEYQDAGLRRSVSSVPPARSALQYTEAAPGVGLGQKERADLVRPAAMRSANSKVLGTLESPLAADPDESSYGVMTATLLAASDKWLPRPSGLPAKMALAAQAGLTSHATVLSGRLPRTRGAVTSATTEVEAAVSRQTAGKLHIGPGSRIHLPHTLGGRLTVHVTGIVEPRHPAGAYWSVTRLLRTPSLVRLPSPDPDPPRYWSAALLLAPDAAPAMLGTPGTPARYFQIAPELSGLSARDLPGFTRALASSTGGPALVRVREGAGGGMGVHTDLSEVVDAYAHLRDGIGPVVAVAGFGSGTVAAVVLLMASALAVDRRRRELALLRARGGSLRGIGGRLLAETAVVAVPAGVLGWGAALLAVPHGRLWPAVGAAAAVTLLACAAAPLRAMAAHRVVRAHESRDDVARSRPTLRRTIAELTVLVLAVGAVAALRRQGGSGGDLVAVAPVLVGVVGALVLVRLHPFPLRWAARPAGRLRGAVGHLSLARAGRGPAGPAVLPFLALLTALATAALGGSVLAGVDHARDRAAMLATGADARVESSQELPAGLADRLRTIRGVREVTPLSISRKTVPADDELDQPTVPLVGADPAAYARLAARTGLGPFPAGELRRPRSADAPLPALASPETAARYGTRPVRLNRDGHVVTVRIVLVRETTPAVPGLDFLVVDAAGLGRQAGTTALLLTGDGLDEQALREAAGHDTAVQVRAVERARYVDSPMQSGAERVYTAAVAAGAGFALLALLLALARAAPERAALLARLRTMGLTRAQGRRLLVLEALPQALLVAAGGAVTGWAAVRLLTSGIDLTTMALATTGQDTPTGTVRLATDLPSLLGPALGVLVLTASVAVVQAWWTGRRGSVTELRAGDGR